MIRKLILLIVFFCGSIYSQPQFHTLSIIPGPILNGPGAIFYLEDTPNGTNSISWKASVSLDSNMDYIWPITTGFNNQPFCTDSTNQTSWCTNITLPNLGEYRSQDSLGIDIPLLRLNSGGWVDFGSISNMDGSGDVLFYREGSVVAKFSTDLALREVFIPPLDQTGRIGSENALWLRVHVVSGDFGRSISPRVDGSIVIHSALTGVNSLILRNRDEDSDTVPELELGSADFIPAVNLTQSIGHTNRRWDGFFDSIIVNGCTGCGTGAGFTEGSIPFSDPSGNLTEDNANLFWDDILNKLGINDNTPDAFLDIDSSALDQVVLIINQRKNDGGSTIVIDITDDRGFSGNNSGTTFKILTRDDGGDDTGAIVDFSTISGNVFYVGIDGDVGIGDNTPDALFDVSSPNDSALVDIHQAKNDGGSTTAFRIIDDRAFLGNNSGTSFNVLTRADGDDDTGAIIHLETIGGSFGGSKFFVGIDGDVGIGTPTPEENLHIVENTDGSATLLLLVNSQPNVAASLNETVELHFGFSLDPNVASIRVGKLDDYTSSAKSDSFLSIYTDLNGTPRERIRIDFDSIRLGPSVANINNDLELVAGDDVNDLDRIRLLNASRTIGWNITFDQATAADEFKIQDADGVDYFTISQNLGVHSFLQPIANQTHTIFFSAGDNVDDDVRVLWQNINASNGYALLWDQSLDLFIIEDHTGADLFILNGSGDISSSHTFTTAIIFNSTVTFSGTGLDYELDRSSSEGFIISRQGGDDIVEIEEISTVLNEIRFQSGSGVADDIQIVLTDESFSNGYKFLWDQSIDDLRIELHDGTALLTLNNSQITTHRTFAPDGDGTRDSGTSVNSWNAVYTEGLNVQEADDTTLIELSNTTASATQYRLNDPDGTRRMNIGFFGAGDNDVVVSLLGPLTADNIAITTAGNNGTAALQIGGNDIVRTRLTAVAKPTCTPDATWSANEQNCLNAFVITFGLLIDRLRTTGGHGLIAD